MNINGKKSGWTSQATCLAVVSVLTMVFCGCTQYPNAYQSSTGKSSSTPVSYNGLQVEIIPQAELINKGTKLVFEVTARNTTENPFMVPKKPEFQFFWIYRNGSRDNQILDLKKDQFYEESDMFLLGPGEQVSYLQSLDTYYFPVLGSVEFRVVYHAVQNSNPDLKTCWTGQSVSNPSAVRVLRPDAHISKYRHAEKKEGLVSSGKVAIILRN